MGCVWGGWEEFEIQMDSVPPPESLLCCPEGFSPPLHTPPPTCSCWGGVGGAALEGAAGLYHRHPRRSLVVLEQDSFFRVSCVLIFQQLLQHGFPSSWAYGEEGAGPSGHHRQGKEGKALLLGKGRWCPGVPGVPAQPPRPVALA